jgi:mRNA interferase MazF
MGMVVKRFDVWLIDLDPTIGSEIKKTRHCVVISPEQMNRNIATAIVAPMITKGKVYPTRVLCQFEGKEGLIILDQIRTVDKTRLVKHLGCIGEDEQKLVLATLAEMFAE